MTTDTITMRILGCGSSGGVPRLGGHWGDCDPANPRNRRQRCSMLVTRTCGTAVTRVLIDTTPDMRGQLLDADVGTLDAVIYTHAHADHVHGIDDLRMLVFNTRARLQVWADGDTSNAAKRGILTNMHIDLDHDTVDAETPDHISPAYDGMELTIPA